MRPGASLLPPDDAASFCAVNSERLSISGAAAATAAAPAAVLASFPINFRRDVDLGVFIDPSTDDPSTDSTWFSFILTLRKNQESTLLSLPITRRLIAICL